MPEYKSIPQFTKAINDRAVTGIFAVHGNIDDGGDRSYPGVFGDFKSGGRMRVVYLWQHDASQPPIAKIDNIFEIGRADLPAEVLQYAPDATGGTAVTRTYLDTPRGNEVLGALRNDAVREMSYAYEVKDWKPQTIDERPVRDIFKSDLLDISDVNWGMNPATLGMKGIPLYIEGQMALAAIDQYIKRREDLYTLRVVKEGRRFSAASVQEIETAITTLKGSVARLEKLIASPEPEKGALADTHALRAEWERRRASLRALGVYRQ